MTRITKFSMIAFALATLGTSVTSASAETLWQASSAGDTSSPAATQTVGVQGSDFPRSANGTATGLAGGVVLQPRSAKNAAAR